MKYFALITLWIIWCVIHSGMISLTFTGHLKKRFGNYYRFYRLFYNIVALITFIPLALYSLSLKSRVLIGLEGYMTAVQLFLLLIVIVLFASGAAKYDIPQFMGVRQIKSGKAYSTLSKSGGLDTSGILGITRHPWYLGAIIFVWISYREMYISTLIVNIILTVYLIIGTILEERKLVIEIGESYRNYKKTVSMLFPWKWLFSRLSNIK